MLMRIFSRLGPRQWLMSLELYSQTVGNLDPGRIREPWRAKSSSTIPRISVYQKEPELLEKILHLMDCDAKLSFRKEMIYGKIKSGALYQFSISNEKLYDDLVRFSKSRTTR